MRSEEARKFTEDEAGDMGGSDGGEFEGVWWGGFV